MHWSSSPTPKTSSAGSASRRNSSTWAGVRSWNVVTGRLDQLGIGEAQSDRRQALHVRSDGVGVGPALTPTGQQRVDQAPHVGLVDDGWCTAPVLSEDPQSQGVE